MTVVIVPSRFNGPPASGQGGYSSGVLAGHFEMPVAVSLRRPVPLDRELILEVECDGAPAAADGSDRLAEGTVARALDAAGGLVADVVAAPSLPPWDAPPVSLEAAHRAKKRFNPPSDGTFDRCFVCGRSRHDGFRLFPGPVEGTDLFASPWTPPDWAAGEDGVVHPEFVWAALDCPGYFAVHGTDLALAFLARQQSEVLAPVRAGFEYIAVGRPLKRDGRKGFAATAIVDTDGEVLARSKQLLVVPRASMSQR